MGGVDRLAQVIATAVRTALETKGMCERGVISGSTVTCNSGSFPYISAVDINLYNDKIVYGQVSADGSFIILGDA